MVEKQISKQRQKHVAVSPVCAVAVRKPEAVSTVTWTKDKLLKEGT